MATVVSDKEVKKVKPKYSDEFEAYLIIQCAKRAFYGTELESFSWYKKLLGLM